MQTEIINHIKEIFQPDAIILHGSRARGKERLHSDWDIILLYSKHLEVKNGREMFKGQNVEYSVYILPLDDIFEEFGTKLQGAKVLYEKDKLGTNLLKQAADYYAQGVHWPPEKVAGHNLWLQGRINGMKDNVDNPIVFEKYFTDFYGRIFNYWYWLLKNKHSQPIYIATEEIATTDPEYYDLIAKLISSVTPVEKAEIAEEIGARLFERLKF